MFGIDEGDDAVEAEVALDFVVGEKGLGDGAGVGEAGGFDEDVVETVAAFHQLAEDADEIAANGAAEASVVHLEDLLVGIDDEGVVDPDLAEFVFDDGDAFAVLGGEDAVEEGRLAGSEEAGEDRDGDAGVSRSGHAQWEGFTSEGGWVSAGGFWICGDRGGGAARGREERRAGAS